ncbi:uncharacterized protein LOC128987832 [Macrosteles quadrilineatus]|uniref:uncharacterized protein LOC128987832 n=1 Tax=Macrosteles quadrilineatus TaxID=74068 RepID=UPI0023E3180D|nr:uncharacterized protein LOC128987832 [Macrosteles quadrilineatus]
MVQSICAMEVTLWFLVVFGSSLILQSSAFGKRSGSSVKGHVLFCPQKYELFNGLLQHYTMKPEDSMNDVLARRKMSFEGNLDVECVKQNDEAKVFVYAPEGYLVDRLMFESKEDCKTLKDNTLIVGKLIPAKANNYDMLDFPVTYTLLGKVRRCVIRPYTLIKLQYYTKLYRREPLLIDCEKRTEIGTAKINYKKGEMLPTGNYEIMEFIKDADFVGEPSYITLKAESNIKLKCQQYSKEERKKDGWTHLTPFAVGYITYENLILERLFLDSCPVGEVEGMYINRLPQSPFYEKEFTLVFKTTKGPCFKISISYMFQELFQDNEQLTYAVNIYRDNHREVNCPDDWNSDAAFNVKPTGRMTKWVHSVVKLAGGD